MHYNCKALPTLLPEEPDKLHRVVKWGPRREGKTPFRIPLPPPGKSAHLACEINIHVTSKKKILSPPSLKL